MVLIITVLRRRRDNNSVPSLPDTLLLRSIGEKETQLIKTVYRRRGSVPSFLDTLVLRFIDEKEMQRMVLIITVLSRHWACLLLTFLSTSTLLPRSKKRRNRDFTWAGEPLDSLVSTWWRRSRITGGGVVAVSKPAKGRGFFGRSFLGLNGPRLWVADNRCEIFCSLRAAK